MKRSFYFLAIISSATLGWGGCTTASHPVLQFQHQPEILPQDAGARLARMQELASTYSDVQANAEDLMLMAEAEYYEEQHDFESARNHWFAALKTSQGAFGRIAFTGWVRSYARSVIYDQRMGEADLNQTLNEQLFLKLILAETQQGDHSEYMRNRGLRNEQTLGPLVHRILLDENIIATDQDDLSTYAEVLTAPAHLPPDDPLLRGVARQYCRAKVKDEASWEAWQNALSPMAQRYWQAQTLLCQNRDIEALKIFTQISANLQKDREHQNWYYETLVRRIQLERSIGDRKKAADLYIELIDEIYFKEKVSAKTLQLASTVFDEQRIDHIMWATRYRAYVADYEKAKYYGQKALDYLDALQLDASKASNQTLLTKVTQLRAEVYHDLAYRVAFEQQELEQAYSLMLIADQIEGLNDEWRDRIKWYLGLYTYLSENYDNAIRKWQQLLELTQDDSLTAGLYFWLSEAYAQLNKEDEASFFKDLLHNSYPVNFYSVVSTGSQNEWAASFGTPDKMRQQLKNSHDYLLPTIRQDETMGPLLARAEILVAASNCKLATPALRELEASFNESLNLQEHTGAFVYLTRLQHSCGDHPAAIRLTTALANQTDKFWQQWPEQLLIYFPKAYYHDFDQVSQSENVPANLLMAIARQESSFNASVRSPANAWGMMQLIRPTALRYMDKPGDRNSLLASLETELVKPSTNIQLGARYLSDLSTRYSSFLPAVCAAYNAGEAATDEWLSKRPHKHPFLFVEMIPFGETKQYVKNSWRNFVVYQYLFGNI